MTEPLGLSTCSACRTSSTPAANDPKTLCQMHPARSTSGSCPSTSVRLHDLRSQGGRSLGTPQALGRIGRLCPAPA